MVSGALTERQAFPCTFCGRLAYPQFARKEVTASHFMVKETCSEGLLSPRPYKLPGFRLRST